MALPPRTRAALLALALPLQACIGAAIPITLDLVPGEVLVVATTSGSGAKLADVRQFVYSGRGSDNLAFTSAAGQPFFTFRLNTADFVRADGSPIALNEFARVRVRLSSARLDLDPDPAKATGSCGRCLVPVRKMPPQIVNDGDSCTVPAFAAGALWSGSNGSYEPKIDPASQRMIEEARQAIRIDWPHPCACSPRADAKRLAALDIRPIAPGPAPWPLQAFAERDSDHLIAGFGDGVAIAFAAGRATPQASALVDFGRKVDAAIALRSGDFLVANQKYNTLNMGGSNLDRFVVPTDGPDRGIISGPLPAAMRLEHVSRMKYLRQNESSPYPRAPLYLLGIARLATSYQPTIAACTDDMFQCASVRLTECAREAVDSALFDITIMNDGTGVAAAPNAIYYKAPRPPPESNPDISDTWTCTQRQVAYEWVRGSPAGSRPTRVRGFRALGRAGNRLFLCGNQVVDQCADTRAVVLTATIGAEPNTLPNPDWRILMTGGDRVLCHRFLDIPGEPERTRLLFNNGVTRDLDQTGSVVQEGRIGTLFPPGAPPWFEISTLSPRSILMRTRENGVYVSDGRASFQRLYGSDRYEGSDYQAIVPTDTGFLAFGNPNGLVEVTVPKDAVGHKEGPPVTTRLTDWRGLRKSGDSLRAAVIDSQRSREGTIAIVVAGGNDSSGRLVPLLRRAFIGRDAATGSRTITDAQDVAIRGGPDGIAFVGLTETAPGRFVITAEGTRIFELSGAEAAEVPIDFDAPDTPEVETKPVHEPSPCGGGTAPFSWRAIDGANGAAWAVGELGLIVRIASGRAERYIAPIEDTRGTSRPVNAEWGAVRALCADRVLIGGQYPEPDLGALAGVWEVAHRGSTPGCTLSARPDPAAIVLDGLLVRQVNETCIGFPNVVDIRFAVPKSFLVDGPSVALVLDSGQIHRVQAMRTERLKVPFSIESAAQNPNGHLLFGGTEARLAVGIPTSTRAP